MSSIWQRAFLRCDPRWVFGAMVIGLFLVVTHAGVRLFQAPRPEPEDAAVAALPEATPPEEETVEARLRYRPAVEDNPFDSRTLRRWLMDRVPRKPPPVAPPPVPDRVPAVAEAPVEAVPEAPETVSLRYQGAFVRPDGTTVALVAVEGASPETRTLTRGEEAVEGFRVQVVGAGRLVLSRDAESLTLPRGVAVELERAR